MSAPCAKIAEPLAAGVVRLEVGGRNSRHAMQATTVAGRIARFDGVAAARFIALGLAAALFVDSRF